MRAILLNILTITVLSLISSQPCYSQTEVYASSVTDSSADLQHAYRITDNNATNYAYLSNTISLLSTSYVKLHFPVSGQAGDVINLTVQGTGQVLGAGLLNSITVRLYDSLGNNVDNASGSSLLQLSLLTNAGNVYALRFLTNPTLNYKFKDVRIEFNNFLTVNLFNEFRIYNAFYSKPCPAVLATSVNAYGTNTLLTGYVTNAGNSVDNDANTYARMTVPLNLLGILPPAYLDLNFNSKGRPGEFVGFTIREASSLLSLSLLQNLTITVYDENGNTVVTQSGFTVANLKLLAGYSDRYMIGVVTPTAGNYRIAHVRLTLNGVLNLLEDVDVFNAFHYRITRPPVAIVASGPTNVCAGGSITLTAIDSTGGTGFLWNTGATTQTITVNTTGTYSVVVTDTVSCSKASGPVQVTILPALHPQVIGDTVFCRSGAGVLRTSVPYASYKWQDNSTGSTFNITNAGKYFVTITDANNCTATDTVVAKYNDLSTGAATANAKCSNTADGAITLNVTKGSGRYGYLWSNAATTANISGVAAGLYTCIITDSAYGCNHNESFTVGAATTLSLRSSIINTGNLDKNDGKINVEAIGGTTYTYAWSNGANTPSVSGLTAGLYSVTVTDASGCFVKDSFTIDNGNNGLTIVPAVTNANSCTTTSGSISLALTGGSGNYAYKWSNGATTSSISTLAPGTYYVTVTDNISALKRSLEVNVGITGVLAVNGNTTSPACNAGNGAITLSVTSGSGNYSYRWNTGATTSGLTNLKPGVYMVTVTDNARGCIQQKTFDVKSTLPTTTLTTVQPLCNSNANGSITLGTLAANYTYKWSNGATTKDVANLLPGVYSVTINDSLTNCKAVYTTVIKERPQIQLSLTSEMNTACLAPFTGGVKTTISGGTAPYTYAWTSGGNTANIANVIGGTYSVTVGDANTCTNMVAVDVATDSTNLVSAVLDSVISVNCIKPNSGQIFVHTDRGVAPYTYMWSSGSVAEDLADVAIGNYSLIVTDAKGCKDSLSAKVDKVPGITLTKATTAIKCFGGSDGAISIMAANGSGNYQYLWSNASKTSQVTGLVAGTYNVTVTDAKTGCSKADTTTLTQPDKVELTITSSNATCANNDGMIQLTAKGGVPPYIYYRDNVTTNNGLTGLAAGSYTLSVTDNNNCRADGGASITKDCDSKINIHDVITPNGDGANDVLVIEGILAYPNNQVQIYNKWGNVVYDQKGYNNTWKGDDKNNSPLPGGTYYYVLKLNAGSAVTGKDTYTGYITVQR